MSTTTPTTAVPNTTPKATNGHPRPLNSKSRPLSAVSPNNVLSGLPAHKEIKRHTSQPILNWFHRKISGGKPGSRKRRGKQLNDTVNQADTELDQAQNPDGTVRGAASNAGRRSLHLHIPESPLRLTQTTVKTVVEQENVKLHGHPETSIHSRAGSLGPSLNWSAREPGEADDDASIRPIPPSIPPSPVPSRSTHSSSATNTSAACTTDHLQTSQSIGPPSTKPTTVMSMDLGPGGHIAQVLPSQSSVLGRNALITASPAPSPSSSRFPHPRSSNALASVSASVSFNMGPSGASGPNRQAPPPTYAVETPTTSTTTSTSMTVPVAGAKLLTHAPGLTHFHPKNNPRPASPPLDNASTLTLASSNFAMSHTSPRSRSIAADRDLGDTNASMLALRPSSRRSSWGSDETGWSATGQSTHTGISAAGPGGLLNIGSSIGPRRRGTGSIATAWSYRTGGTGPLDQAVDGEEQVTEEDLGTHDQGSLMCDACSGHITPTEDVLFDLPESVECMRPEDIPLPASPILDAE
ncbi:uncharacterized protein EI90DRAFT_3127827 [Cantharellus anzutake]|uniref:uncharacterized protein n=1 Tax=Cantharellus anzutake TaxID=1750568 RepID=UPI001908F44A|nr:uncharacterized protein EI90DRAFT_3127827 [Cantharellus anzutake]KAF8326661.1 hypothetical protein EI90DRAFT_3127827 [Cantharellus anzutake]